MVLIFHDEIPWFLNNHHYVGDSKVNKLQTTSYWEGGVHKKQIQYYISLMTPNMK